MNPVLHEYTVDLIKDLVLIFISAQGSWSPFRLPFCNCKTGLVEKRSWIDGHVMTQGEMLLKKRKLCRGAGKDGRVVTENIDGRWVYVCWLWTRDFVHMTDIITCFFSHNKMRQLTLFFLFTILGASFQFEDGIPEDPGNLLAGAPDLTWDLFSTWSSSAGDPTTMNIDLFSQSNEEGAPSQDFLAVDCPSSSDGLQSRDDRSTCSANPLNVPRLPTTLDELTNELSSFDNGNVDDNKIKTVDPVLEELRVHGVELTDQRRCPPDSPYHLCCLCDPTFMNMVCRDCLPSKQSLLCLSKLSVLIIIAIFCLRSSFERYLQIEGGRKVLGARKSRRYHHSFIAPQLSKANKFPPRACSGFDSMLCTLHWSLLSRLRHQDCGESIRRNDFFISSTPLPFSSLSLFFDYCTSR